MSQALPTEFGIISAEERQKAEAFLSLIDDKRDKILEDVQGSVEFFEPAFTIDVESRKKVDQKIKHLDQTSAMMALVYSHEIKLKLLYIIDGYRAAVLGRNPLSIYLVARYCLELAATVNYVSEDLQAALTTDLRDWLGRGTRFLTALMRARYSSSDPEITAAYRKFKASRRAVEPMQIGDAIKRLAATEGFSSVIPDYDFLSNICHHNGSGLRLFARGMRVTNTVHLRSGSTILVPSGAPAYTFEYPAVRAADVAFIQTAGLVFHCSDKVLNLIAAMPMKPFSEEDVAAVTQGRLVDSLQFFEAKDEAERASFIARNTVKLGRNDPCACGSGKKFKHCCKPFMQ